jgi:hypothetical protein
MVLSCIDSRVLVEDVFDQNDFVTVARFLEGQASANLGQNGFHIFREAAKTQLPPCCHCMLRDGKGTEVQADDDQASAITGSPQQN